MNNYLRIFHYYVIRASSSRALHNHNMNTLLAARHYVSDWRLFPPAQLLTSKFIYIRTLYFNQQKRRLFDFAVLLTRQI